MAHQFVGQWSLDLDKSDPITPMLEALKVNPAFRKAALHLQVTQDISLDDKLQMLRIRNKSTFGVSVTTQVLNGKEQSVTDPNTNETSLYTAQYDDHSEYPLSVYCQLPQNKGFTREYRRLLQEGKEMEQKIEYRATQHSAADSGVVMHRYWTRVGEVPKLVTQKTSAVEVEQTKPSSSAKAKTTVEEDWPLMGILLGFASVCWMSELRIDAFVWFGFLLAVRFVAEQESVTEQLRGKEFAFVPVVMAFFTRAWFVEEESLRFPATVLSLVALAWTQHVRLMQAYENRHNLFAAQQQQQVYAKYWLELCAVLVACTVIIGGSSDLALLLPSVGLYALARFRLHRAFISSQTPPAAPAVAVNKEKPATAMGLEIHVTKSRISQDSAGRAFAQYLIVVKRAGKPVVETWCRYSDLELCYQEIAKTFPAPLVKVPRFPAKHWIGSTSDSTIERRVNKLDAFFSSVAQLGCNEVDLFQLRTFHDIILGEDKLVSADLCKLRSDRALVLRAKAFLERNAAVGTGLGWKLVDKERRVYARNNASEYKQVIELPHMDVTQALHVIKNTRSKWDSKFRGEVLLGTNTFAVEDDDDLLAGMVVERKRIFHETQHEAHETVVVQCAFDNAWVEASTDNDKLEGFVHDNITTNGFVFEVHGKTGGCIATYVFSTSAPHQSFYPITLT